MFGACLSGLSYVLSACTGRGVESNEVILEHTPPTFIVLCSANLRTWISQKQAFILMMRNPYIILFELPA